MIAEALVVDSKAGVKRSVKNEAFCARGGTSRRVFYVPARSGTQAMRYTGEYQIAKSKGGAETLRVTIAGAVHRRAGGYRGGERDEDRHCGQFPRDRVCEALWRERRGVRSDDAEGVRDDVAIEKAKPA